MKNYYLISNGRLERHDNTLYMRSADGARKPIPVEDVDSLYLYGEVDINTKALVFLARMHIPVHVFNYYGFYSGSYYPREYLHSGFLMVHQVRHYIDPLCRMPLAREIVRGSAHSILRTVAYYANRREGQGSDLEENEPDAEIAPPAGEAGGPRETAQAFPGPRSASSAVGQSSIAWDAAVEGAVDDSLAADTLDEGFPEEGGAGRPQAPYEDESAPSLQALRSAIEAMSGQIGACEQINTLLGVEGKMRERYYAAWPLILGDAWGFHRRVRRPPNNEVNALISFGNSVLYTACLSEIYRTQLTPTISYLHQPGARRFSLALDLSEVFKPLIVDRTIFRLLNTRQMNESHFSKELDGCYLNEAGRKIFLTAMEERFKATIRHRRLGRHVSYRHLIRLECYKLIRHLTGLEQYRAFRAWW